MTDQLPPTGTPGSPHDELPAMTPVARVEGPASTGRQTGRSSATGCRQETRRTL